MCSKLCKKIFSWLQYKKKIDILVLSEIMIMFKNKEVSEKIKHFVVYNDLATPWASKSKLFSNETCVLLTFSTNKETV